MKYSISKDNWICGNGRKWTGPYNSRYEAEFGLWGLYSNDKATIGRFLVEKAGPWLFCVSLNGLPIVYGDFNFISDWLKTIGVAIHYKGIQKKFNEIDDKYKAVAENEKNGLWAWQTAYHKRKGRNG